MNETELMIAGVENEQAREFNSRASQALEASRAALRAVREEPVAVGDDWPTMAARVEILRREAYEASRSVAALAIEERPGVIDIAVKALQAELQSAADAESKARLKASQALKKAGISPETMSCYSVNPPAAEAQFEHQLRNHPDVRKAADEVADIRESFNAATRHRGEASGIATRALAEFRAVAASLM